MGLLDEAIREHLELKRQHGADPDDLAREERAALAPLRAGGEREADEPSLDDDVDEPRDDGADVNVDTDERPADDDEGNGVPPDSSNVVQETVEIDMRTVLEGEDDEGVGAADEDGEASATSPGGRREPRTTPVVARVEPLSSTPEAEEEPLEAPAKRGRLFKRRARS